METSFYLENCHFGCGYKRDVLELQCPRMELNKRSLPKPTTIAGWKLIPHRSKICMNWNPPRWDSIIYKYFFLVYFNTEWYCFYCLKSSLLLLSTIFNIFHDHTFNLVFFLNIVHTFNNWTIIRLLSSLIALNILTWNINSLIFLYDQVTNLQFKIAGIRTALWFISSGTQFYVAVWNS